MFESCVIFFIHSCLLHLTKMAITLHNDLIMATIYENTN